MSDRLKRVRFGFLGVTAAVFAMTSIASADITIAVWNDDEHFDFNANYMPDLDQNWEFLPGDGSMFCVPTSTMNLFAYAAEWGVPSLPPGPGVWQGDVPYGEIVGHLFSLGDSMNTGTTGTNVTGWLNGMEAWLGDYSLTYAATYKTDDWCPTLSDAAYLTAYGALVNLCYGRYNFNDGPQPILGTRTSGHCVTMAHAHADGPNDMRLWVRNPSNSSDILTQEPWAYGIFDVENKSVLQDWDDNSSYFPVDATVINYDPEGTKIRLIDKVYSLFPATGSTWDTVTLNVGPISNDFWAGSPTQTFTPWSGFSFADVALHSDCTTYYVLMAETGITWLMLADPLTGDMDLLTTIPGATDIVVGRHRELFILAGNQVHKANLQGQIERTVSLPYPAQAIAFCDTTDEVIVVSTLAQRMRIYPESLGSETEPVFEYFLPSAIPPSLDPSIAVRDTDCAIAILVPEADDKIYGVRVPSPGGPVEWMQLSVPGLDATGVAFDDRAHLLVATADTSVKDFKRDGCWWCWSLASPSRYDGIQVRGAFRVSRSRTNYDPDINALDDIDTPSEELDYFGTIVYDCPGDFDNDVMVGVTDMLSLLANWGPCPGCLQDIDGDGLVGVSDLLVLLGLWGACDP